MDKMRPIFLLFLTTSFNVESIVIRHDTPDEQYINRTKVIDAHVTFTTPSKGSDYVVGSGTYLGKGWVLTAAHVANFFEDKDVAQLKSEKLKITEVLLHEKWKDRQFGFDIALVKIDMPKGDITPVTLFSYELKKGDVITIAGKGDTGNGLVGIKQQTLRRRRGRRRTRRFRAESRSTSLRRGRRCQPVPQSR